MKNYYYLRLLQFINNEIKLRKQFLYIFDTRFILFKKINGVLEYLYFYTNLINKNEYDYIVEKLNLFLKYDSYNN